jgi:choline dehydrogenase
VGVEYVDSAGNRHEIRAAREVLLSAGAIGSPSILLRSGIGDPEQVATLGVELVAASPEVGQNLQDHLACAVIFASTEPVTLAGAEKKSEVLKYLARRRGMLTSNVGEAAAFVRSSPDIDAPDVELVFAPVAFVDHGRGADAARHGLTIAAVLLHPTSRGSISLQSADPGAKPVIDPRYLSDGSDAAVLRWGVRQAGALFSTRALAPLIGDPIEAPDGESDAAVDDFIAEQAETIYHPVGTCRMGAGSNSVVDSQLRVRGVDGLRVVDVSVVPTITRGHTHAPAVMIGERAAALITAGDERSLASN